MKATKQSDMKAPLYEFPYHTIRRISSPEDDRSDRVVHAGNAPARSFLDLSDNSNVRSDLVDAEGRKKRRPTQVHLAIRETLESNPDDFSILNGGITMVATAVQIDEKARVARLRDPSIINGSQTRAELKRYFQRRDKDGVEPAEVHVTFELIQTDDEDLIAEISIARNFQVDVGKLSIAGRRRQLDELDAAFRKHDPEARLQTSETHLSEQYTKTEKLLQVIAALIPPELWPNEKERGNPNKVYTYSMKSRCLKDFTNLYERAQAMDPVDAEARELYQFYLDVCYEAWQIYIKWREHPDWRGQRIFAIDREDNGKIREVPDGLVFPCLGALSAFSVKVAGKWTVRPPVRFADKDLIARATEVYREIAASNPSSMGKSRACYSNLFQITSLYRRLSSEGE